MRKKGSKASLAALLCGFAALVLVAWLLPRPGGTAFRPGQVEPFSAMAGDERVPALSPDATRVAFAWNGGEGSGAYDLYLRRIDSEQWVRLTHSPSDWLHPAWSPDGKSVAFARRTAGAGGVFIVPATGGPERQLVRAKLSGGPFIQVAWSPDGRTIAYAEDAAEVQGIHLRDVTTGVDRLLGRPPGCWKAGMPAWSVDGRRFAFVCVTGVGLYTVLKSGADGADASALAELRGRPRGLTWELNGSGLIVASDEDGGSLWRVTMSGAATKLPFGEDGAGPSRAGRYLAFARARTPEAIWRIDLAALDPGGTAEPVVGSARQDSAPAFSADGQRIVFQSTRSAKSDIWMAEAGGAKPMALTRFEGASAGNPAICADGMRVALDASVDGDPQLFIVDVDERQPRLVRSTEPVLRLPQWSSDCFWLLASDGRGRLFKLPAAGGRAEPFTERASYRAQVVDDRVVFNVIRDEGVTLWVKSMRGGQERSLDGLPPLDIDDAWAATRSGVYFTADEDGGTAAWFYGFDDRKVRRVTSLPGAWPGGGIAVSRDDRWLLFTRPVATDGDLMLVDLRP